MRLIKSISSIRNVLYTLYELSYCIVSYLNVFIYILIHIHIHMYILVCESVLLSLKGCRGVVLLFEVSPSCLQQQQREKKPSSFVFILLLWLPSAPTFLHFALLSVACLCTCRLFQLRSPLSVFRQLAVRTQCERAYARLVQCR